MSSISMPPLQTSRPTPPPASDHESASPKRPAAFRDRIPRRFLLESLSGLRHGRLTVNDSIDSHVFGDAGPDQLAATVTIHNPSVYQQILSGGSVGAAEAYMQGYWSCDDLTTVLRILTRNRETVNQLDRKQGLLKRLFRRGYHALRSNTRPGARQNIQAHYDLGNDFFSLFLDETMMYSSAMFDQPDTSLHQASLTKIDRICRKLRLNPSDHLLEIGTGWGGFAEYAARHYGCRITTTTISREQYEFARQRIEATGLSDRVTLLLKDYRDLEGSFDKLVSIEMIEAVGYEYYDTFFATCGKLLKPNGSMLLQAITMPEQRYQEYLRSVDFIQRYIFPGGCLPSVMTMGQSIASTTDMRIVDLEDFAEHYARTLHCWRDRFFNRIDDVRELGFSDSFIRMWEYYFCCCEAAFLERATGVVQLLAEKPQARSDVVRHLSPL